MSHNSEYGQKVNDPNKFRNICRKYGHEVIEANRVHLYGNNYVDCAFAVHLKGWKYPIAISAEGQVYYDHWGSAPETMGHLGEVFQAYDLARTVDIIPLDEVQNYFIETLPNGDKKLIMEYE